MSTLRVTAEQRDSAIEQLRTLIPQGSDVYVIQRHVSRSGMLRRVSVVIPLPPVKADPRPRIRNVTVLIGQAAGFSLSDSGGDWEIVLNGAGMDMHFHLVYRLAHALYGDGYALNKVTL